MVYKNLSTQELVAIRIAKKSALAKSLKKMNSDRRIIGTVNKVLSSRGVRKENNGRL